MRLQKSDNLEFGAFILRTRQKKDFSSQMDFSSSLVGLQLVLTTQKGN